MMYKTISSYSLDSLIIDLNCQRIKTVISILFDHWNKVFVAVYAEDVLGDIIKDLNKLPDSGSQSHSETDVSNE